MAQSRFIRWFREHGITDVLLVGGKNASLGGMYRELTSKGRRIPNGFAVTAAGYRRVLQAGGLAQQIRTILTGLDTQDLANLAERGRRVREAIRTAPPVMEKAAEVTAWWVPRCVLRQLT